MATSSNRTDVETGIFNVLRVNITADLPDGFLTNAKVLASAGISASKLQQHKTVCYAQAGTVATETVILGIIRGTTGLTLAVEVSNVTANAGASTVTVDVKKNGTTILSSVVTLTSGTGAPGVETGTVTVTALADGDVLTAVITSVQSGTDALATGVAVQVDWNEDHPQA